MELEEALPQPDGTTLTASNGVWSAIPQQPSEIEYESTHSSGEDYMLTKVNGDDGVSVVAMTYDNDEYVEGDNVSIGGGSIDIGRGDGDTFISINPIEIGFNAVDSNDDPISGSLSISVRGELQWNGDDLAYASDILPIPACPTTTDGHYMLAATVSSGVVTYSWEAIAPASGNSF